MISTVESGKIDLIELTNDKQGYSLTESSCTGTVMENEDMSAGTVGKPMTGLEVKLVDWEEGGYRQANILQASVCYVQICQKRWRIGCVIPRYKL